VAIRLNHQRITTEHILKALLEDEQGMAAGLIRAAGGNPDLAASEVDAALAKLPSVTGSGRPSLPDSTTMPSGSSIKPSRSPRSPGTAM
jgi:ATP-dependent Clp protease ATP-binding subunit ClpB